MAGDDKTFDYVIVGGGSAGCVLANRLTEDAGVTVCLLEAGPPDRSPFIHVPLGVMRAMFHPKINWKYFTAKQSNLNRRRVYIPRGKTLGGSSSINGMVYMRGHRTDYDDWAAAGNDGWSWAEVLPYFMKSENNEQFGGDGLHGTGGPLNVTFISNPHPLNDVLVEAAESLQYRANRDFNGPEQDGFGLGQVTQKNGRRWSAAKAYLEPARNRPNLEVMTDAPVNRVVIENGRAAGVELAAGGRRIAARREVILSAGAITSPLILMRSGIGDTEELKGKGIDATHHLPGVGKNLMDHAAINTIVKCASTETYGLSFSALPGHALAVLDYVFRRRGMFSSNMVEADGFVRTDPSLPRPDIQYVFIPGYRSKPTKMVGWGHGYGLSTVLLRPKSRGEVRLAGKDPAAGPVIDPRFFSAEPDLDVLQRGLEIARRILKSPPFQRYGPTELYPGEAVTSPDAVRDYIRDYAATIFHPTGTCKMGSDPMAVVDPSLRVRGVDGLRVVDASIMPSIIGGNTNAPTMMIAEKAADMIHGRQPLSAADTARAA